VLFPAEIGFINLNESAQFVAAGPNEGDVGSKTTFIVLIHWTSILRLTRAINNFTDFKYLFEETGFVILFLTSGG
jgi:hypothetical protein